MKFAIIGGLGFLGNEIARQIIAEGDELFIVDNLHRVAPDIEDIKNTKTYNVDIRNFDHLYEVLSAEMPDSVIHTAAIHYIPECNDNPTLAFEVNVTGTLNVLRAVEKIQPSHCVILSSGAVYADSDDLLVEDTSDLNISDVYGMTKTFNENTVNFYARLNPEILFSVVRMFNIIGPRETNAHIIPEIITQLKSSDILQLGNIKPRRDMIFVNDAARACYLLAKRSKGTSLETVNVSTGEDISMEEIISLIKKEIQRPIEVLTDASRYRKVDKMFQKGDNTRLFQLTGFKPAYSIEESIKSILLYEGFYV